MGFPEVITNPYKWNPSFTPNFTTAFFWSHFEGNLCYHLCLNSYNPPETHHRTSPGLELRQIHLFLVSNKKPENRCQLVFSGDGGYVVGLVWLPMTHPWDERYIYLLIYHKNQPNLGKYTIHGILWVGNFGYIKTPTWAESIGNIAIFRKIHGWFASFFGGGKCMVWISWSIGRNSGSKHQKTHEKTGHRSLHHLENFQWDTPNAPEIGGRWLSVLQTEWSYPPGFHHDSVIPTEKFSVQNCKTLSLLACLFWTKMTFAKLESY